MAHYVLVSQWQLDAPLDRVWDALLRSADWPTWWRGIRSVERLSDGDERGVGMRLRQQWRSMLPYTLELELEILEVEQRRLLIGRASGDMTGRCTFSFGERDGRTVVRFEMDVRPAKAWMNIPVPLAGRVVAANYDALMRWGGQGLARRLGVDLAAGSATEPTAPMAMARDAAPGMSLRLTDLRRLAFLQGR